MLEITSLKEEHLTEAAGLVSRRYQHLCGIVPTLPSRYSEVDALLSLQKDLLAASGKGAVAFQDGKMVGFLSGWQMESFRGRKSVYSPEWGNGAELESSSGVYEALYSRLAEEWVSGGYLAHYISLFPDDEKALKVWNWLGFGMISVDGLCEVKSDHLQKDEVKIRRANPQDLPTVVDLREGLRQYMITSPIFLPQEKKDEGYYAEWLADDGKVIWLAEQKGKPAAFMQLGPADMDVCTIVQDNGTASIYAAFTKEAQRQGGMGEALLKRSLHWAKEAGYQRMAVSFEPMNVPGSRFWLKHFQPVCYSLVRIVDERMRQI